MASASITGAEGDCDIGGTMELREIATDVYACMK